MIDLTDFGYVSAIGCSCSTRAAPLQGTLGGPSDYINRPGARFAVTYQLPESEQQRTMRGSFRRCSSKAGQDDVSYPWPLDYRPPTASLAGTFPHMNVSSAAPGSTVPIGGLIAELRHSAWGSPSRSFAARSATFTGSARRRWRMAPAWSRCRSSRGREPPS
jgi:hypothetical protein